MEAEPRDAGFFAAFAETRVQDGLLALSRGILERLVHEGKPGRLAPGSLPAGLDRLRPGLFVTLKKGGQLRGCIGHIVGHKELADSLPELGWAAASEDPRFPPVRPEEVPGIRIELSILSPPRPVGGWQDIVLGRHGILLACRGRQAVFLPQVPGEQGWDLPATLGALSRKAGLPPDAWRSQDCAFSVFEAIHFSEAA